MNFHLSETDPLRNPAPSTTARSFELSSTDTPNAISVSKNSPITDAPATSPLCETSASTATKASAVILLIIVPKINLGGVGSQATYGPRRQRPLYQLDRVPGQHDRFVPKPPTRARCTVI